MVKVGQLILQHLCHIMQPYLAVSEGRIPALDRRLSQYFREHLSLGGDERRELYRLSYQLVRYHYLLDYMCGGSRKVEVRLEVLGEKQMYAEMENENNAKWIRCAFPELLYKKIEKAVEGSSSGLDICKALNSRAPLTIRVNPLKISRADFMKKLQKVLKIGLKETQISPYGVIVTQGRNINLQQTKQFINGEFEIQDQGSQISAMQVKCRPGNTVLDYCSGSGGKSLAIAHLLQGSGRMYLHDPREKIIEQAKKRFIKADVKNTKFYSSNLELQKNMREKVDWLILDVPCSGTGRIRRNPEIKLRFNESLLKYYRIQQQQIFAKAIKYLKQNGQIVYMTCSLLKEENEEQIQSFVKSFGLEVVNNQILRTKMVKGGMDGMFAAVLRKKRF